MEAKRHFHTFDALRFLAFFKVFMLHIPIGYPKLFAYLKGGGSIGVQFFFVLSGFLITYLLAEEKQRTGRINIRFFLMRRALRIWPLYYLVVAFAFATPYILSVMNLSHSDEGYQPNFFFTCAFLENYVGMFKGEAPNVSPLGVVWAICVEQHFYLVWGLLFCVTSLRHLERIICACIAVAMLTRAVNLSLGFQNLDLLTNFDLFAFGALPAFWLVKHGAAFEEKINAIPLKAKEMFAVAVLVIVAVAHHVTGTVAAIFSPSVLGILLASLLVMLLPIKSKLRIGDDNILSRLGKYTYGLYLCHVVIINLLSRLFEHWGLSLDVPGYGAALVIAAIGISILIAYVSYQWIERPFLALRRYT
jgi:peptidoglycan/LPS O-acetylase OafA/YrhL